MDADKALLFFAGLYKIGQTVFLVQDLSFETPAFRSKNRSTIIYPKGTRGIITGIDSTHLGVSPNMYNIEIDKYILCQIPEYLLSR